VAEVIAAVAPGLSVEEVDVPGPPTSVDVRGAGWVEALVLVGAARGVDEVRSPSGATATASIDPVDGSVDVHVRCGRPLDEVVLRSYVIGAAHQALGWVRREGLAVDGDGTVHDLTIRSFGILRAREMPAVRVVIEDDDTEPVNGSDAAFAAVALAAWRAAGLATRWPVERR
jgi:CO/xanthine dehydrogenase Mo-binding subunit